MVELIAFEIFKFNFKKKHIKIFFIFRSRLYIIYSDFSFSSY